MSTGIGEDTFRAWRKGDITLENYELFNALWVAENMGEYPVATVERLPAVLMSYAEGRLSGVGAYEASTAQRLGMWFKSTVEAMDQNSANLRVLSWVAQKLESPEAPLGIREVVILRMEQFKGIEQMRPDEIDLVLKVKAIDAYERSQRMRNTG